MDLYLETWRKSFQLKGRASRTEFWVFELFYWAGLFALGALLNVSPEFGTVLVWIWYVGTGPAHFCVSVRRMHDTDRSGWWIICPFLNLIFWCCKGDSGVNRFGPNPNQPTSRTPNSRHCTDCGIEVTVGAQFCHSCGSSVLRNT
jgi:uncharacterized membrane protein YhaH (DUF805 family)